MKMKEAVHKFEELNKLATNKCGIIVHKEHQFLASTPDCLIGESCVLEVKCPYTAKDKKNHQEMSHIYIYVTKQEN